MWFSQKIVGRKSLYLAGCAVLAAIPTVSHAQATTGSTLTEVIVTARKREESLQDVPVVVSALGKQQIEAFQIRSALDITTMVPSVLVQSAGNGFGAVGIRGISTSTTQGAGEQAVNLVLDGVTISHGNALKAGLIDMAQIEVLKGPQALYFGKNASGGVVSMTTAGPTDEFFSQVRFAHEFNAQESTAEAILSGPITESLGYRLVGSYSTMEGWMENRAIAPVRDRTGPDYRDLFGRLTLEYRPSDAFDATMKASYLDHKGNGIGQTQGTVCKPGPVRTEPADDCTANNHFVMADPPGIPAPFDRYMFFVSSLEANLKLAENITLTSLTGYWRIKDSRSQSATPQDQGPLIVGTTPMQKVDNFSQELRVTTDFAGRLNGMAGVFFDKGKVAQTDRVTAHPLIGGARPVASPIAAPMHQVVDQKSFSVFAQATFKRLRISNCPAARATSGTRRRSRGVRLRPSRPSRLDRCGSSRTRRPTPI
jgi:outer membrane receptor protein involved in Fe transport